MTLKQLLEERTKLVEKVHALAKPVQAENRMLTDDEQKAFDAATRAVEAMDKQISVLEAAQRCAREAQQTDESLENESRQQHREQRRSFEDDPNRPLTSLDRARAVRAWLCQGQGSSDQDIQLMQRAGFSPSQTSIQMRFDRGRSEFGDRVLAPRSHEQVLEQSRHRRSLEQRADQPQAAGTDNLGGFAVPDEMMREIDIALLAFGGMREAATVLSTDTGADLPIPTVNDTAEEGEIVAENATVTNEDVTFGQLVLGAFMYSSKSVKVSHQLMQDSATNMATLLGRLLGERIGRIQNNHFTTGTGTGQPNGIVTAAADSGVTAAAAQYTFGELLQLKHAVDRAYRAQGPKWMVNDATLLTMKQIADGQSRIMWLPSLTSGEPGTYDGDGIIVNNSMPTGSSAKAVIYGALQKYMIREVTGFNLYRLNELYMANLQVGFLGTMRADGNLLDAGTNPVQYLTNAV